MRDMFMVVTRDMLRHTHYEWSDSPDEGRGVAGNDWERLFASADGCEVLAVLQKATDALHIEQVSQVQTLEDMLVRELPRASMSRHDAFMWLYVEYKKRSYGS